jgi:hypothetical protein
MKRNTGVVVLWFGRKGGGVAVFGFVRNLGRALWLDYLFIYFGFLLLTENGY